MAKKKSINPFKMMGPWIGAGAAFISSLVYVPQTIFGKIGLDQILVIPMQNTSFFVWKSAAMASIGIPLTVGIGFLAGWGIHSLSRKYRR